MRRIFTNPKKRFVVVHGESGSGKTFIVDMIPEALERVRSDLTTKIFKLGEYNRNAVVLRVFMVDGKALTTKEADEKGKQLDDETVNALFDDWYLKSGAAEADLIIIDGGCTTKPTFQKVKEVAEIAAVIQIGGDKELIERTHNVRNEKGYVDGERVKSKENIEERMRWYRNCNFPEIYKDEISSGKYMRIYLEKGCTSEQWAMKMEGGINFVLKSLGIHKTVELCKKEKKEKKDYNFGVKCL